MGPGRLTGEILTEKLLKRRAGQGPQNRHVCCPQRALTQEGDESGKIATVSR